MKSLPPLDIRDIRIIQAIPYDAKEFLNVGAGELRIDTHLRAAGLNVFSVDIEGPSEYKGNILHLDTFPIKQAEVVLCSETLEHIADFRTALENLIEIAVRRLIITIPVKRSFNASGHIHHWSDDRSDEFRDIHEFIDLVYPLKINITKIYTKERDRETGSQCYLIVVQM